MEAIDPRAEKGGEGVLTAEQLFIDKMGISVVGRNSDRPDDNSPVSAANATTIIDSASEEEEPIKSSSKKPGKQKINKPLVLLSLNLQKSRSCQIAKVPSQQIKKIYRRP